MNEVMQVTKMNLMLEQRGFIIKWYYETHMLKRVCDHFIQEFLQPVIFTFMRQIIPSHDPIPDKKGTNMMKH